MKTTQADFDLWTVKQNVPTWARSFRQPVKGCVDRCINRRADSSRESDNARALGNLCSLLFTARRNIARGSLMEGPRTLPGYLAQLIADPGTVICPKQRSQWAARFARGLRRGESRRVS